MKTTFLIAADSIRALLHQRLLVGLMLISLALTAFFSFSLTKTRAVMTKTFTDRSAADSLTGERRLSDTDRMRLAVQMEQMDSTFQALFYQVASFGGSLVSLFIFGTAVATEVRKGTIRVTLSKPVSRSQYLLGKYLGGVVVMVGYALIASAAIMLFSRYERSALSPALKYAPWLMLCRQLMLGSLAMLLSLFCHPFLAAGLAFFAGNGMLSSTNPLYYVLPSYSAFNVFGEVLNGTIMDAKDVLLLSLYAVDFVTLMLLLALWRFRTQELI